MRETLREQLRHYDELARQILDGLPELETCEDLRPRREIVAFLIDHGTIDASVARDAGFDVENVKEISTALQGLNAGVISLRHGL